MRFNTALGCTEARKAGSNEPFVAVDERMRNTIAIKARLDGIGCVGQRYPTIYGVGFLLRLLILWIFSSKVLRRTMERKESY